MHSPDPRTTPVFHPQDLSNDCSNQYIISLDFLRDPLKLNVISPLNAEIDNLFVERELGLHIFSAGLSTNIPDCLNRGPSFLHL